MIIELGNSVKYTTEFIFSKLSDWEIYEYYLEEKIYPNKLISCRFHDDSDPSLGFYKTKFGNIRYNCFSCGNKGGAIDLVCEIKQISFQEAIKLIVDDLILTGNYKKNTTTTTYNKRSEFKVVKSTDLYIERRSFNITDVNYWKQYNISLEDLLYFNVFAAKRVFYKKGSKSYKLLGVDTVNNPIYIYKYGNGYKVYKPLNESKKGKWFQTTNKDDLQGLQSLNNISEVLFITSSLKDAIILYKYGYAAIAPNSESNVIPDNIILQFKKQFKKIVLLYDSDIAGYKYAFHHKKLYNKINTNDGKDNEDVSYVFIPRYYLTKDISDFVKSYGFETGRRLVKRLLWKIDN